MIHITPTAVAIIIAAASIVVPVILWLKERPRPEESRKFLHDNRTKYVFFWARIQNLIGKKGLAEDYAEDIRICTDLFTRLQSLSFTEPQHQINWVELETEFLHVWKRIEQIEEGLQTPVITPTGERMPA